MMIPNKFNGYSADGRRLYNDPASAMALSTAATEAGIASSAAAAAGTAGALEAGLTAGSLLAGGTELGGLFSNFMAGASPNLGGLASLPITTAAEIAPAAVAQASGTIAPSVVQSAGLDALKQQALQGGLSQVTPTIEQMGAKFLANSPPIANPGVAETLLADASGKIAPQSLVNAQGQLGGTVSTPWGGVQPYQYGNYPVGSPLYAEQLTTPQPFTPPIAEGSPYLKDIAGKIAQPDAFSQALTTQGEQLASSVPAEKVFEAQQFGELPKPPTYIERGGNWWQNLKSLAQNPSLQGFKDYAEEHPYATAAGAYGLYKAMQSKNEAPPTSPGMIRPYTYDRTQRAEAYARPTSDTSERLYFNDRYTALKPYEAPGPEYKAAGGGLASLAVGGPVEEMAAQNAVGANTGYPMAALQTPMYANPAVQRPEATNVIAPSVDAGVGAYTGEQKFAIGGVSHLGDYSDGGRLLKGPGDGVSDSIPASIGGRQPARLADGEFVVPARIVSELGNGSTEAGARKLYAMMDRIQKARKKSVGSDKVAVNSKADKYLPA